MTGVQTCALPIWGGVFPTAYFFNAAFAESNEIGIHPSAFLRIVSGFLIDPRLEIERGEGHRFAPSELSQPDDCASRCRARKNDRKITGSACFITAEINGAYRLV